MAASRRSAQKKQGGFYAEANITPRRLYRHLLVGAPKEMNIVRSTAMKEKGVSPYRAEAGISQEAQNQIVEIIKREKREQYRKRAMQ